MYDSSKNLRPHYRTIVLSDIHLGTKHAKVNEVTDYLSSVDCDRLILNGDIIGMDGFGASGPAEELYKYFGITVDEVVDAVRNCLK